MNIVGNLIPAHNLLNPLYIGSNALSSAIEIRSTLYNLCLVSKRTNAIAKPYLYRVIVIRDSNKLKRLKEILVEDSARQSPVLCRYIESLSVHQNLVAPTSLEERRMSRKEFSDTILSILRRTPRLITMSLVPIGTKVFRVSAPQTPPRHLKKERKKEKSAPRGDYCHKFQSFWLVISGGRRRHGRLIFTTYGNLGHFDFRCDVVDTRRIS